jgi:CHAD domain-containing protein
MPPLDIDLTPGEALKKLARRTIVACLKDIGAILGGGTVHEPRKRLKFLRSLLHLVRPGLGETRYRRANSRLRDAALFLADARRAEAHGEAASKLMAGDAGKRPAVAELGAIAARAHAHVAAPAALAKATKAARAEIETLRLEVRDWSLPKRDVTLFLAGLRRAYARARRKLLEGLAANDVATLHEARKSVIHHLHHLEILEPLWPDLIGVWIGELTKLRTALGDLNDLEELQELVDDRTTEFSSPKRRKEAAEAIRLRRKELLRRVRKLVRHLFAEKPPALTERIGAMWTQHRGPRGAEMPRAGH